MAEAVGNLLTADLESLTKDPKAVEDFSKSADEAIAHSEVLSKAGRRDEAVEELLALEKRARQSSDGPSVARLAKQVLLICKEAGDWRGLNEHVATLAKKRSQLKRTIVDMVQLSMTWIDETPDKDTKLALIDTLSQVTDGKIFVEVERARLIMILSKIREAEGNIDEAANLLQEVQVETFGAMERREKSEYILEQMRIVLAKKDYIRCQIISKKINVKLLEPEDFQDIKLKFYEYMIQYHLHEADHLEIAKSYFAIFSTPLVQANAEKWMATLECYVMFLLLTPFGNERSDLLNRVNTMEVKKLSEIPVFKRLINECLTPELMEWPLPYEAQLRSHHVFSSAAELEGGAERWSLLRTRILQHNIITLAGYYDKMRLERVAHFLSIEPDEAESQIAELVNSGHLLAKMNRPAGIVTFGGRKDAMDRLNKWSTHMSKVLDLLEESCHLVEKERMLHTAKAKKLQALQKAAAEAATSAS